MGECEDCEAAEEIALGLGAPTLPVVLDGTCYCIGECCCVSFRPRANSCIAAGEQGFLFLQSRAMKPAKRSIPLCPVPEEFKGKKDVQASDFALVGRKNGGSCTNLMQHLFGSHD